MRYIEIRPRAPLSDHVECFWLLEGDARGQSAPPERLLPDGCVELILNFGDPFQEHLQEASTARLQPLRFVVGQMTRPVLISPTGWIELLGVRFASAGALPFMRIPLYKLTDSIIPLSDIAPALDREISRYASLRGGLQSKAARVESLLLRLMDSGQINTLQLRAATKHIVASGGRITVDEIASGIGISGRQLERRFLTEVGLSPKLLSRILRFQQVFRAVEQVNMNWAAVAADCGYYDQAHLIRDFRQFAGRTPSVQFDDFTRFSEMFTRKHRF